jgi:hypothetical protein
MQWRRRRRTIRYNQTPQPPPPQHRRAIVLAVAISGATVIAWLVFTALLHRFA